MSKKFRFSKLSEKSVKMVNLNIKLTLPQLKLDYKSQLFKQDQQSKLIIKDLDAQLKSMDHFKVIFKIENNIY